jgi:hypothetical protein
MRNLPDKFLFFLLIKIANCKSFASSYSVKIAKSCICFSRYGADQFGKALNLHLQLMAKCIATAAHNERSTPNHCTKDTRPGEWSPLNIPPIITTYNE